MLPPEDPSTEGPSTVGTCPPVPQLVARASRLHDRRQLARVELDCRRAFCEHVVDEVAQAAGGVHRVQFVF